MKAGLFTTLALASLAAAQTSTKCDPLKKTCPDDPALGGYADFDFTKGKSDRFVTIGGDPSYGDDGATFEIKKQGDAPTLESKFYIMFGHVEWELQAAPGTGVISSAILQSDDLDEIDWEFVGGDANNVQSNYYGKGITGNYDRAAFHNNPDGQTKLKTYAIDWTKDQITWSIDGQTVRTLTPKDADNGDQYPQTPMNIRTGIWAGGDPSNAQGTIEWAGGVTDYSQAPFKMLLKSLKVTDYSTGKNYSYGDKSGNWTSIKAEDGKVEGTGEPNKGKDVKSDPSSGEKTMTGTPSFPNFEPPHPTTVVTHPAIYPWVPAASATATATGAAAQGVIQYSGAERSRGRTFGLMTRSAFLAGDANPLRTSFSNATATFGSAYATGTGSSTGSSSGPSATKTNNAPPVHSSNAASSVQVSGLTGGVLAVALGLLALA